MGFVDKVKGMFVSLDEEYDDEVEFIQNQDIRGGDTSIRHSGYEGEEERGASRRGASSTAGSGNAGNKVVNIHATTQLQVVLVKPEQFEEASAIADHLNAKRTVVLNLESANKDLSRRLIDFLSGVAYANNGQIKRVANSTFIITPYNVDIMGGLIDELESNGVYI